MRTKKKAIMMIKMRKKKKMKALHFLMKLNKSYIALLLDTKALFPEKPYPTNP